MIIGEKKIKIMIPNKITDFMFFDLLFLPLLKRKNAIKNAGTKNKESVLTNAAIPIKQADKQGNLFFSEERIKTYNAESKKKIANKSISAKVYLIM